MKPQLRSRPSRDRIASRAIVLDVLGARGTENAPCPCHDDRRPSLSVRDAPGGGVWLKCFAGCDRDRVRAEVARRVEATGYMLSRPGRVRATGAELTAKQTEAAARARERYDASVACIRHPYLRERGIPALREHDLRQDARGALVVPMYSPTGEIENLQRIFRDRDGRWRKRFERGGRVRGLHFGLGARTERILICEGLATGASLHAATGDGVMVAFTATNLRAVAEVARRRAPDVVRVICADFDGGGERNPGLAAAMVAARATGALLATPKLDAAAACDFNDVHREVGPTAVRQQVEAAQAPPAADGVATFRLADIEPRPVRWLWRDRLALGKVSLLAGDPGLGKSFCALSIAAHVTRGRRWPVSRTGRAPEATC